MRDYICECLVKAGLWARSRHIDEAVEFFAYYGIESIVVLGYNKSVDGFGWYEMGFGCVKTNKSFSVDCKQLYPFLGEGI